MPKTIKTKDGIVLNNVPDNVSEDEIKARIATIRAERSGSPVQAAPESAPVSMMEGLGRPAPQPPIPGLSERVSSLIDPNRKGYDPTDPSFGMSKPEWLAAGAGRSVVERARGVGQMLGLVDDKTIAEARERDAPLMRRPAAQVGGVLGDVATFAPAMMIPGGQSYVGASLMGAGMGATQPVLEDESRLENMAWGTAGGVAGRASGNALARVLSPKSAPGARELLDDDIELTPGMALGGVWRRMEEGAKRIPFLGQGIRNAEIRANQQFNKAAINKALAPVSAKIDDVGHGGLAKAHEIISKSYDDAIGQIKRVDLDQDFDTALTNIRGMTSTLPKAERDQFERILKTDLLDKLTPARSASGQTYKTIVSQLDKKAAGYRKTPDFDKQQLGDALYSVAAELKSLAGRIDPDAQAAIGQADKAYAMLLRLERAGASAGADEGVFSPNMLASAIRGMDGSLRKRSVAHGEGLMQDFAESGKRVMGSKMPDSGTPEALATMLALYGGYTLNPALAAGTIAARGAYTPVGQKALVSLLAKRPELMRKAGNTVGHLAAPAALTGSALSTRGQ